MFYGVVNTPLKIAVDGKLRGKGAYYAIEKKENDCRIKVWIYFFMWRNIYVLKWEVRFSDRNVKQCINGQVEEVF